MKHSPFWHHYENKLHTDILIDGVTLLMTYGTGSFEWESVCVFLIISSQTCSQEDLPPWMLPY